MEAAEGKILVVAEKPSVAADFARVLPDKFAKEAKHYEGEKYIISYAVGHLVTIADPGEIDERFKAWKLETLPILPDTFELKPIEDNKAQLSALTKLMRRKDVSLIINACDAGREGELIFRYIVDFANRTRKVGKPVKRLWLQSMTAGSIREAFANLRSEEEMVNLGEAALCRSEADWLVGINGSRGLTAYNSRQGGFFLTPCGRVQTPTLSLMVEREKERRAFVSKDFWTLEGEFVAGGADYKGRWFDPKFAREEGEGAQKPERLWDLSVAEAIAKKVKGKSGTVEENTKPSSQKCGQLYDLTTLQREANGRFGFSAKATLSVAQSLYEKHKALTYPRTDSRFLPDDYLKQTWATMGSLVGGPYGKFAQEAIDQKYIRPDKRIFDNSKVSDHHAIIPTGTAPKTLSEPERKIYELVLQRYIAVFFPAAEYRNTVRITVVEDESFRTEGKVLVKPGWRAIYGKVEDEEIINPLGAPTASCTNVTTVGDATRPPPRFNEATLLSAMESAGKLVEDEELREALKERGLGTPATRAAVIEKLISDKYLQRDGRDLSPTRKAFDLLGQITAMKIEDLRSAELTGEWEHRLKQIERGERTREEFMGEIRDLASHIVTQIRGFNEGDSRTVAPFSPVDGKVVYDYLGHFECEDGTKRVRKILGGRHMAVEEIADLYTKGQAGPYHDFVSRKGSAFTALLRIDAEGKVEFVFEDRDSDADGNPLDLSTQEPLGVSPVDQSPVYATLSSYVSKSAIDGDDKGLRINRSILGRAIEPEHIQAMLRGEKTPLLVGFRSARTRKNFDAYLRLDEKGKIHFEFPPRKTPVRGRGKAAGAAKSEGAAEEGAPAEGGAEE